MLESVTIAGGGPDLAADLFIPNNSHGRFPAVIAGSGFAGVKEMLLPVFAKALADAGIATLNIDFAGFGASAGTPRQRVDPRAQIAELRRGLDFLCADPRFDSSRLGIWGPSMCGAHALVVAGTDARIRAAVSVIPFVKAPREPPSLGIALALAEDAVRRALRLAPKLIKVAGLPKERAVMTNDGALDWLQAMSAQAPLYRNEVLAESLLRVGAYRPMKLVGAGGIRVPLRVVLAESDSITPAAAARAELRDVPGIDVVEFPGTHFELFGEHLSEVVALTVEWFTKHLDVTLPCAAPGIQPGAT